MPGQPPPPVIERGACFVKLAFDVGLAIDLDAADRHIAKATQRERIKHRRRTPRSFEYQPPPLRLSWAARPLDLGPFRTDPLVDCLIYDFGALSVTYRVGLSGPLPGLLDLADALYENEALLLDARSRARELLLAIGPAVRKPHMAEFCEDYAVYQLGMLAPPASPEEIIAAHGPLLARVLRAEHAELSKQETDEALAARVSYGTSDTALVDWNASIVFDEDADDVIAVLEYANVELLEMRQLDDQLDRLLDRSYEALSRRDWRRRIPLLNPKGLELRRIALLQTESAVLFEGVNNALKLLGDQYLARVYRAAAQRLHLPQWDASILRKLQTVDSIYAKITDQRAATRMEVLEWIIIVLIAVSIGIAFVPGTSH